MKRHDSLLMPSDLLLMPMLSVEADVMNSGLKLKAKSDEWSSLLEYRERKSTKEQRGWLVGVNLACWTLLDYALQTPRSMNSHGWMGRELVSSWLRSPPGSKLKATRNNSIGQQCCNNDAMAHFLTCEPGICCLVGVIISPSYHHYG